MLSDGLIDHNEQVLYMVLCPVVVTNSKENVFLFMHLLNQYLVPFGEALKEAFTQVVVCYRATILLRD